MKRLISLLLSLLALTCAAQTEVKGTVRDSATHKPLEMANVTLLRQGSAVAFTKTDGQGRFSLNAKQGDHISVTYLGYRKRVLPVSGKSLAVSLAAEPFALKEVEVKGGRVLGRADTTTYDLTRFATERDVTLKDVLKKLPGVDVSKDGQVSYNGKPISRLTVEGLDLTGGRYNQVNEALKATDVDKAEIIEHDQPVKALQDKLYTDDVAMNIKLKDTARDKWLATLPPTALLNPANLEDTRIGGWVDAYQIGRGKQQLYHADYDRTGRDVATANRQLARATLTNVSFPSIPQFYTVPSLSFPLDDERLRWNTSADLRFSRVTKTEGGSERRWGAEYLHTTERQHTENHSSYYIDGMADAPVETTEYRDLRLRQDRITLDFNGGLNTEKAYGNEYFRLEGTKADALSALGNTMTEQVTTPSLHLSNAFTRMLVRDKHQWSFASTVDIQHAPSTLSVDGKEEKLTATQWYADNSATLLLPQLKGTSSYKAGFTVNHLNVGRRWTRLSLYVNPSWEFKLRKKTTLRLNVPVKWENFAPMGRQFLATSPNFLFDWNHKRRHEVWVLGHYSREAGTWESFALPAYRQNYRTMVVSEGELPVTESLSGTVAYTYKRPVWELFWTARVDWLHSWLTQQTDLRIEEGNYLLSIVRSPHEMDYLRIGGDVSKGFFDLHLKAKLGISGSVTEGEQLSNGKAYGYRLGQLKAEPEVIFSPAWGELSYRGTFLLAQSRMAETTLSSLFNWTQHLSLTKTVGKVDVSLAAVHYHNEFQQSAPLNTLLADASIAWRMRRLRLSAEVRNLFNRQDYAVTAYSGVSSVTDTYRLRPREILLKASWTLR